MLLRKTWSLERGAEICSNYTLNKKKKTKVGNYLWADFKISFGFGVQSPFLASQVKVRLHGCEAVGRDGMGMMSGGFHLDYMTISFDD